VGGEHYCSSDPGAYAGVSVAAVEFTQVGQFPAEEARQRMSHYEEVARIP